MYIEIRKILSTATSTLIPNYETTEKRSDIKRQHSIQDKKAEVEINNKMFATRVFINPGRYIFCVKASDFPC